MQSEKMCVVLLFGGMSSEHEVSRVSVGNFVNNIDREKYEVLTVGITKEGRWLYTEATAAQMADGSWEELAGNMACVISPDRADHGMILFTPEGHVEKVHVDVVIPVLHGLWGEDGTVQGLLELAGIPYVGCGVLASALCMDKDAAHRLARAAGVEVPPCAVLHAPPRPEVLAACTHGLRYPLFVKPACAGSSFGVTRVETPDALPAAVAEAFRHDGKVLVEQAVPGFEVGCAVLGAGEALTVGEVDEIELAHGFFDYTEKYTLETARIHMPARLSLAERDRVREAAKTVYRALCCTGFARVDLFYTPDGRIVFNEVNTIPGFTEHSRFPGMMRGAGVEFGPLVERLLEQAVADV